MTEALKKRKRSEEDVTELLQRYNAPAILSLLQEVSEYTTKHSDCVKIDWNALVKTTSTGISSAREYQMLWRHLAYHNPLLEKIEDETEPLDDDSDLEFELEAVPALSTEELAEAKECAKIILSSGSPLICGSTLRPAAETSSNADTPNEQALLDHSEKLPGSTSGGHTVLPASNQKSSLSIGPSVEGLDANGAGSSGLPAKKKRQLWTKEEDMELIAAVQKCGEGNWANILKGDFKHNRTASQLSQRWALIRKRLGTSNTSNGNKTNSSTRSEERLAAQKAFSLAVDMPMTGGISSIFSGSTQVGNSSTSSAATSQASRACAAQSLNQSQDKGTSSLLLKARPPPMKKPGIPGKPLVGPNPLIQAAAFAAGGRIANPSTAASLFKAAQSKNAVHIRPGIGSLPMSSAMASKPSSISNSSAPQSTLNPIPARPASFGTTLSSQRSSQPASPLTSCTTSADSKSEAVQGPNLLCYFGGRVS
ncbi:uncharacterized protein A4U43_C09F10030 [Asparagus officinalis]|uniref:Uncharacterized protein n=1 Tax=Asparagus officinalis TaxID=4686 RepID=A0A5P1E711_ASPOF|nr:uncharacterized protein LOC109823368 [Asparagus officinalis]ONK58239.1 uncharacterized protein A4U43_C09F10030 [Asparagus officinalis]